MGHYENQFVANGGSGTISPTKWIGRRMVVRFGCGYGIRSQWILWLLTYICQDSLVLQYHENAGKMSWYQSTETIYNTNRKQKFWDLCNEFKWCFLLCIYEDNVSRV